MQKQTESFQEKIYQWFPMGCEIKILILVCTLLFSLHSKADCKIFKSNGLQVEGLSDVLFINLNSQESCPNGVVELKNILQDDNLKISPSMVANRGKHNPKFGSFSFFEIAEGHSITLGRQIKNDELYFGHFTKGGGGVVSLDQSPRPGKLLIELIAWDSEKAVYNFYELIGASSGALSTWFYRGDSTDALKDNEFLHKQVDPASPQFGQSMRCSACHTSGGPIMKEIDFPHNDWWTENNPLLFGNNKPSEQVKKWLSQILDASKFSIAVKSGIKKLDDSQKFQKFKNGLSLQEKLRPLFCTTEINLISDLDPLESTKGALFVASKYWVNPLLSSGSPIEMGKAGYLSVLQEEGFQFPETHRMDGDHAWLAPIKGHSDTLGLQKLLEEKMIDGEFVADVLSVDFKNPLFSKKRCSLLNLLPLLSEANWKNRFLDKLKVSQLEGAKDLFLNMTETKKNIEFHQNQADIYLVHLQSKVQSAKGLKEEILRLQNQRLSVFENEISKNPLGQILEPGFRVIFPVVK